MSEALKQDIADLVLLAGKRDEPAELAVVPSEIWSDWINLELINGWENIPHYYPLSFKMRMTLEGTLIELRGAVRNAEGRDQSPITVLPDDVRPPIGRLGRPWTLRRITQTDGNDRIVESQTISIDETGFLFAKMERHD